MRLIDADALIDEAMDRYCKECDKRKGIKNGKWKIVYEIGEAPCRACDVDDMIDDLENAPTISPDMAQVIAYECGKDSVAVVRCKDCKWWKREENQAGEIGDDYFCVFDCNKSYREDFFCADGERKSE